jgi:Domain of unknown function (DUF4126)
MSPVEVLGMAASLSLLAGWRLYACVLGAGIAMWLGLLPLPEHIQSLQVLANPWVMGVAAVGFIAEFFADKVAWLDSAWDTVHTLIRPLGGAALALAVVDSSDTAWQVAAFLLGGGATLLAHGAKAGTRGVINASPEPFSNVAMSSIEDVVTVGGLWLLFEKPEIGVALAIGLLLLVGLLLWKSVQMIRRLSRSVKDWFFGS